MRRDCSCVHHARADRWAVGGMARVRHRRPMSGDITLNIGIRCASSRARAPASILTDAPSGCTLHNFPLSRTYHTTPLPPLTRQPPAHVYRPTRAKRNVRSHPPGGPPVPPKIGTLVLAPPPTKPADPPQYPTQRTQRTISPESGTIRTMQRVRISRSPRPCQTEQESLPRQSSEASLAGRFSAGGTTVTPPLRVAPLSLTGRGKEVTQDMWTSRTS